MFHYAPGRGARHARALLAGYRGILQCDGYVAYNGLTAPAGVTLAFCWSHVRRGCYDLAKKNATPVATEALQQIAALYAIDAEVRGKPAELRHAVRQVKSRPLVDELFTWFETRLARVPRASPTAEAIRFALNHRDRLRRFLEEWQIELDTNTVERAIRPLVLS